MKFDGSYVRFLQLDCRPSHIRFKIVFMNFIEICLIFVIKQRTIKKDYLLNKNFLNEKLFIKQELVRTRVIKNTVEYIQLNTYS